MANADIIISLHLWDVGSCRSAYQCQAADSLPPRPPQIPLLLAWKIQAWVIDSSH